MKGWEMHMGCVGLAPSSLLSSAASCDLHPQPRATSACCSAIGSAALGHTGHYPAGR